jgi:hypothetical protein
MVFGEKVGDEKGQNPSMAASTKEYSRDTDGFRTGMLSRRAGASGGILSRSLAAPDQVRGRELGKGATFVAEE